MAAAVSSKVVTKNIKTPDPILEEGIEKSVSIMKTGRIYRYNCDSAETSEVSKCETALAAYTGHKYCVSLNSCGSGIFLMLKCLGVEPGDKVLTNVFTFAAVPSAIVHANAEPVYVNCTPGFILDLEDLELKAKEGDAKVCVVSHMRGKVSDMDKVKEICDRYNVTMVEDCAHSLGVYWNGTHTGHHGVACAVSSQSYKMLNSGEGGFLLTDDDEIAAKAMCYAGSYEKLYVKHSSCPPHEVMERVRHETPNFSLRMHEVTAAMLRPQIETLDERREKYNERYYRMEEKLASMECITIEKQLPQVLICGDSIQFNVHGVSEVELEDFQALCKDRGVITEVFGAASNARNFKNWHFAQLPGPDCEPTHEIIKYAVDLRLPLLFEDEEIDLMADIILESMNSVLEARKEPQVLTSFM
jgi:dTDP-4-amino-4,6-dideoxygalactose transaminase